MKYKVVWESTLKNLEVQVGKLLDAGWILQGGVSRTKVGFMQARTLQV